jgi:hypothetical protein
MSLSSSSDSETDLASLSWSQIQGGHFVGEKATGSRLQSSTISATPPDPTGHSHLSGKHLESPSSPSISRIELIKKGRESLEAYRSKHESSPNSRLKDISPSRQRTDSKEASPTKMHLHSHSPMTGTNHAAAINEEESLLEARYWTSSSQAAPLERASPLQALEAARPNLQDIPVLSPLSMSLPPLAGTGTGEVDEEGKEIKSTFHRGPTESSLSLSFSREYAGIHSVPTATTSSMVSSTLQGGEPMTMSNFAVQSQSQSQSPTHTLHLQREEEQSEAVARILQGKESEIRALYEKLKGLEEHHCRREEDLLQQIGRVQEAANAQERELGIQLKQMKGRSSEELQRIVILHQKQMNDLRASHAEDIAQLKRAQKQKEDEFQQTRERLLRMEQKRAKQAEVASQEKMKVFASNLHQQIEQLHGQLRQESQRLAVAREELVVMTAEKNQEVLTIEKRFHGKEIQLNEQVESLQLKIRNMEELHEQREAQLQTFFTRQQSEREAERESMLAHIRQRNTYIQTLEREIAHAQETHARRISDMVQELSKLQRATNTIAEKSRISDESFHHEQKSAAVYRRENSIMQQELGMMEEEVKRLREENITLTHEMSRINGIVYGRKKR